MPKEDREGSYGFRVSQIRGTDPQEEMQRILETFRKWDIHGDDYITRQELSKILKHFGFQAGDMKTIFDSIDTSGNGRIELAEFVNWLSGSTCNEVIRRNALAPMYKLRVDSITMNIEHHESFDGWWSDHQSIRPFVRLRDVLTEQALFASQEGQGLRSTVEFKDAGRKAQPWDFDIVDGSYPGVDVELCLARTLRGAQVIGTGTLLLSDVAEGIAAGRGRASLSLQVFSDEEAVAQKRRPSRDDSQLSTSSLPAKSLDEAPPAPASALESNPIQPAVNPAVKRLVATITLHLRENPPNDAVWAQKKVSHWLQQGLPSLPLLEDVQQVLQTLTVAVDRHLLATVLEIAEDILLDKVAPFAHWTGERAEKELEEVLSWSRALEATVEESPELRRLAAGGLGRLRERLAGSVLSASLNGEVADHQLMRPALSFACAMDPQIPELQRVEDSFKALMHFPRNIKLNDLLNASQKDMARCEPPDFGLELGSDSQLPQIDDKVRFGVRDATAQNVLKLLGCKTKLDHKKGASYVKLAMETISARDFEVPEPVTALMAQAKLFIGEKVARKKSIPELLATQDADKEALLGRFDVVAIPARADYDAGFQLRKQEGYSIFGTDPKEPIGGPGWFWVFHAAAINIGENDRADDFAEYSMPPDTGYRGRHGHSKWLDEERYVYDMGLLWRRTVESAKNVGIEDMVMFPFGMGAFLRNLHKLDHRYSDAAAIRRLRYRVALGLFEAAAEICLTCSPPMRIHICLVDLSMESRSNHNVFIEAAAAKVKEVPALGALLRFHRNADALALAHSLAAKAPPGRPDLDVTVRKVGLLNGANNKQFGNHWFSNGARSAIDENLHRRSVAMSVGSLLLNLSTEPRSRSLQELACHVDVVGGEVVELTPYPVKKERVRLTSRILAKVSIVPYGVLGAQLSKDRHIINAAPEPGPLEVVLDPAGLPYIQDHGPSGAGGASGQLYKWLGINHEAHFPEDVRQRITKPLLAKFHAYDNGSKNAIHVVGPNFQSRRSCSYEVAVSELTQAYHSALKEFVECPLQRLRMLPISSSIFAGHFAAQMPQLTAQALHNSFSLLDPAAQDQLLAKEYISMCIFEEEQLQVYQDAFRSMI